MNKNLYDIIRNEYKFVFINFPIAWQLVKFVNFTSMDEINAL